MAQRLTDVLDQKAIAADLAEKSLTREHRRRRELSGEEVDAAVLGILRQLADLNSLDALYVASKARGAILAIIMKVASARAEKDSEVE